MNNLLSYCGLVDARISASKKIYLNRKSEYPEPSPCHVDLSVHLKGIFDIDEDRNTISLFLRLSTKWTDERINLYRSEEDKNM